MRKIKAVFLSLLVWASVPGQTQALAGKDSIELYFKEFKETSLREYKLWQRNLYGPMLLVNAETRQVFANEPDSSGMLVKEGNIYTGMLPANINISNTAVVWGGKRWAMIILQHVPQDPCERINLFAHESFHREQPALGFTGGMEENNHLDEKNGRIYLRLEMEALKKALQSATLSEQKKHLTDAFLFRQYRRTLYPGSDTTENQLEINEGMAEYTGLIYSGRGSETRAHLVKGIDSFIKNPTFVRSFFFNTTPVYGYLLYNDQHNWNKDINETTDLTNYFMKAFGIVLPPALKTATDKIAAGYNGKNIVAEETEREEERLRKVAEYKKKFVEQPHLEISFEKMNISFDPRNIVPVEDLGNVYTTIRVTDNWGILTVRKEALLSADWKKISVSSPGSLTGKVIEGEGWTLELKENYTIVGDETGVHYKLVKK